MRLAIMQPYFFPYQGYFQLIAAVDRFVIYDDVSFIKNGWINRNRVPMTSGVGYFTIPLSGASSFRTIRDTACAPPELWRGKMLRMLEQVYARAPQREAGLAMADRVLQAANSQSIRDVAVASIREVCSYANLSPTWQDTSTVYGNANLGGCDRVFDICAREKATSYTNLPGGRSLYDPECFLQRGIALRFLAPVLDPYPQCRTEQFIPGMSVLDLIMNTSREEVVRHLQLGRVSA